jgi:hypothetical protein
LIRCLLTSVVATKKIQVENESSAYPSAGH